MREDNKREMRLIRCSRSKEVKDISTSKRMHLFNLPQLSFLPLSFRIFWEFYSGFIFIDKYHLAVSIFGSARDVLPKRYYQDAEELGRFFAVNKFAIVTGGAGGIMRSGNKGAYYAKGDSIGINIYIPEEQASNRYTTKSRDHDFFFARKTILSYASEIYIYFPGGFGTLDELMEILTLIQTQKIPRIPIILYGKEFWTPIVEIFEKQLYEKYHTINEDDKSLYKICDTVDEVKDYVSTFNFLDREKAVLIQRDL